MSLEGFISQNASALFALGGAIVGAIASFLSAWVLSQREVRLKLREKVVDRRIAAHEKIIDLSHSLRTMLALGGHDAEGELARTPALLASKAQFDAWFSYFHLTVSETSSWLRNDLMRELNLLQDYIVNLNELLRAVPDRHFPVVGQLIRLDFVHFSESVEKLAFRFFTEDLEKLRINSLKEWHKYPLEETHLRLQNTQLIVRREEIAALAARP